MNRSSSGLLRWLQATDLGLCSLANLGCRLAGIRGFFALFSRLGDGLLWYCLILALPLVDGTEGARLALQMALTGAVGVVLYTWLKRKTARPRPFQVHRHILVGGRVLDAGSFPSGHTLHAVGFTTLLLGAHPDAWVVLVPVAGLIAASRLVLGLHYPSDVISGGLIGGCLAGLSMTLVGTAT